jgi:hypothetical protein
MGHGDLEHSVARNMCSLLPPGIMACPDTVAMHDNT